MPGTRTWAGRSWRKRNSGIRAGELQPNLIPIFGQGLDYKHTQVRERYVSEREMLSFSIKIDRHGPDTSPPPLTLVHTTIPNIAKFPPIDKRLCLIAAICWRTQVLTLLTAVRPLSARIGPSRILVSSQAGWMSWFCLLSNAKLSGNPDNCSYWLPKYSLNAFDVGLISHDFVI